MTSRFPYPLEKGDKLRLYHQVKELSNHFDLYLFALSESEIPNNDQDQLEKYCTAIKICKVSPIQRAVHLLTAIVSRIPWQVAFHTSSVAKKTLRDWYEVVDPHAVYVQLARMGEYILTDMRVVVVDYMDAFSVGMRRRADVVSPYKRWVYKLEAKRMAAYERYLYERCQGHTIISQQDAVAIEIGPLTTVSNGIDTIFFNNQGGGQCTHQLGFVGNMGYLPNIAAAEYLCKEINREGKYSVLIAGARPSPRVKQLASDYVTVSGWVDDIRSSYLAIEVFVAPLYKGTGQQNKILEAMAMGIPVVTTKEVNDAIGATPGLEVEVAGSPEEYREAIDRLLNDEDYRTQMAAAARSFVVARYSWQSQTQPLIDLLNRQIR